MLSVAKSTTKQKTHIKREKRELQLNKIDPNLNPNRKMLPEDIRKGKDLTDDPESTPRLKYEAKADGQVWIKRQPCPRGCMKQTEGEIYCLLPSYLYSIGSASFPLANPRIRFLLCLQW